MANSREMNKTHVQIEETTWKTRIQACYIISLTRYVIGVEAVFLMKRIKHVQQKEKRAPYVKRVIILQQFADPFQKNTHHETSSTKLMHFWMNTII